MGMMEAGPNPPTITLRKPLSSWKIPHMLPENPQALLINYGRFCPGGGAFVLRGILFGENIRWILFRGLYPRGYCLNIVPGVFCLEGFVVRGIMSGSILQILIIPIGKSLWYTWYPIKTSATELSPMEKAIMFFLLITKCKLGHSYTIWISTQWASETL